MKNRYDSFIDTLTLTYVLVPIGLFFIGWLRPLYSVPTTGVLMYTAFRYAQKNSRTPVVANVTINWSRVSLIAGMALAWVYCSGIGGYASQDWDHHFRNALFHDLLTLDWPIYYDFPARYHFAELAGKHSALNYYFTFWLPAACVGKVFGQPVAEAFLFAWSYVGVLLALYYVNRLFNFTYSLACTGLFILWSGFDGLGYLLIRQRLPQLSELAETYYYYYYTGFTTDLFNPFNQTIPAWILTLYVLNKPQKLHIFPVAILLAYAPFPFAGLVVVHTVSYLFFTYQPDKSMRIYGQDWLSALLQIETVGALLILFIYGLFYQAHSTSVPSLPFWTRYLIRGPKMNTLLVISYGVTFLVEAGLYLLFIYVLAKQTYQANKLWFWLILTGLLVLPLWIVGTFNDLASRGSIPFLTVLLVLTLKALIELYQNQRRINTFYAVLAVLCFSFLTPIYNLIRSEPFAAPRIRDSIGSFADPRIDEANDPEGLRGSVNNFYSHDPQRYIFYRYLAKQ